MAEAHDWSLRPHAQQATRPSPTTQVDMRPESQRRKRSSFIKAKLMLRLSFFSFLENQAARECGRQGTSRVSNRTRRGPKTRPWNDTQAKAHGTKPSDGTPRRNAQKCSKLASNVAFFFRTSAAKPASPSLQLNITPGRFLEEIRTLSSPSKEHHIRGPF